LATAGAVHTIRLWDVAKGAARTVLQGHDDLVFQIAFARDGQTVASASRDRTLRIWDVEAAQPVQTFRAHLNQIEALAVSQDGAQIATGGRDGLVRVWDAATGLERATMVGHANHVNALAFDAAASRLASAGGKSPLRIWDLSSGGCARVIDAIQRASDLAFTADGRSLLAASSGGALLIDVGSGTVRVPLPTPGEEQCCVALHPDGQTVATGSITGEIRLWDLRSGDAPGIRCTASTWSSWRAAPGSCRLRMTARSACGTWRVASRSPGSR
jgi:WD40 repeat protein